MERAPKRIIIVGAGIGGLAAGCYAQLCGYRSRIYEMHSTPGGVCTAWQRHGYTFDGCIHNLAGTTPTSAFHNMWRELGVIPNVAMRGHPELVRVERPDGEPLTVYADLDRLQQHLKELAPHDGAVIDELIQAARQFTRIDVLGLALAKPFERLRALISAAPLFAKYGGTTLEQFAGRFSDQFLRSAFPTLVYDWPQQSMLMLLQFLGRLHIGDLGWPVGGSRAVVQAIAQHYEQLGGRVSYDSPVRNVLVEDGRAAGVVLGDGTEHRADIVISNANGHGTIFGMLGGKYTSRAIRSYYGEPEDRIEMGIHVSLGVARYLSREPHAIVLPLEQPVMIADQLRQRLFVEPFGFDASLAPAGKSVLKVVMATSFRYWWELHKNPERYAAEKAKIGNAVIDLLAGRFAGLRRQVETIDVATPMTTLRFTGNGHGYRMPISRTIRNLVTGRRLSQTLPGLANFYMVGQWAGVPGVSSVAAMGRDVVREICRRDQRPFIAEATSRTSPTGAIRVLAF